MVRIPIARILTASAFAAASRLSISVGKCQTYSGLRFDGTAAAPRFRSGSADSRLLSAGRDRGRRRDRIGSTLRSSRSTAWGRRSHAGSRCSVSRPSATFSGSAHGATRSRCRRSGSATSSATRRRSSRVSSARRRAVGAGGLKILTARVADDTGEIKATWFNQPWLEAKLVAGTAVRIRGRANRHGFAVSSYDLDGDAETGDFAPVYPAGEDVTQKKLRDLHAQALERVHDVGEELPADAARCRAAAATGGRAVGDPPPEVARRGRGRPDAARVRRAARPPARAPAYCRRARERVRAAARRAG